MDAPDIQRTDTPDEALLLAHRQGDANAFGPLVERYRRELYHFLVRFTGNRAAAEDVFQEAFLQVHQSAGTFDVSRRFRPWLFTIAANKARDYLRSANRRAAVPLQDRLGEGGEGGEFIALLESAEPDPEAIIEHKEMQTRVQDTVNALPEHFREILLLGYFHQFPYRQIAEMLSIPLGTVKSRLHSAVGAFGDKWNSANRGQSNA